MDLSDWIGVFDRLLPRSRAWDLTPEKTLRSFIEGLAIAPKNARDHLSRIFAEMLPAATTYLHDWSQQFGSLIDLDADELTAEWAAIGGQDPDYIQTRIQEICPNCYVHEWWVPESDPVEARNPFSPTNLIESSYVLVNDVTDMYPNYLYVFGDGTTEFRATSDPDVAEFGAYDGYIWRLKRYPCPDIENEYPTYWYVGGETWPDFAHIAPSKLRPLMRMIFKLKPVHTRVILRVIPDGDEPYDIQDTVDATDTEFQDSVSATTVEIQDYT